MQLKILAKPDVRNLMFFLVLGHYVLIPKKKVILHIIKGHNSGMIKVR